MKNLVSVILVLVITALTRSEFLQEIFTFHQNKTFLIDTSTNLIYTTTASTEFECSLQCQSYSTCCGGYYNYSSLECKLGISDCCHAEWSDSPHSTVFHRISKVAVSECKTSQYGKEYKGTVNKTIQGITCQAWSSSVPHSHDWNVILSNESNYCRNPDNSILGPWCYTTDANNRWEFCNIPFCVSDVCRRECKLDQEGHDYRGNTNVTVNGNTCQAWEGISPWTELFTERNFCRNPYGKPNGPWCFSTNLTVEWEYCDVPMCT